MNRRPLRLRVEVDARPEPTLLQSAIAARLAGQLWAGPERAVADAVADAVAAARAERKQPWR
jgi:hypothetical protein